MSGGLSDAGRRDVTETELIGGVEKRDIVIVDYDPAWRDIFREHQARIASRLGGAARMIEHIGSTSVDGLAAKPIIDILVVVDDITAESSYVDPLIDGGYVLRVREPGHRLVRTPERDVHVHIVQVGDIAIENYLTLRNRLRDNEFDRNLYERTKRGLAIHNWSDMNAYAAARTDVIAEILDRGRGKSI